MSIERFHTNDRMSQMVIHGDTVYLAGQVALGAPGESVAGQTAGLAPGGLASPARPRAGALRIVLYCTVVYCSALYCIVL